MLKKLLLAVLAIIVLMGIAAAVLYSNKSLREAVFLKPWSGFDLATATPAPDYTKEEAWAALPQTKDLADVTPADSDVRDGQAEALVDVFFIHPTTYYSKDGWNAHFDEGGTTKELLESGVLRYQASAYNGCCRIFAPRYRQATLYSFMDKSGDGDKALDLAYQDVSAAFEEFIAHRNMGRPFIIAAHSQGSLHGIRLLREKIAGTPLARRMVAAYLIGSSLPVEADVPGIPVCESASETGCMINWNSVRDAVDRENWTVNGKTWADGAYTKIGEKELTCINPLTWKRNDTAPASANLGSLPFVTADQPFPAAEPALTGAACSNDVLVVSPPEKEGYTYGVFNGDYHIYDYNLFYLNIRENLRTRIDSFLAR
ncbi:MAG: DUF3089 domain-containing protein [Rhizobiales bacterium]|nr:DUF3089 domain-containing protein [Hyphomicrobiales bacterium]